jgi:hypothetical protein
MSEVESTTDQTESNEPLWQVQLASGQLCRMTLELLDDAFQDGLITEDTLIMQDGTSEWVTLRDVAGLDSEDEAPASDDTSAPVAAVTETPAMARAPVEMAAPIAVAPPVAAPVQRVAPTEPRPYMDPFAPPIQVASQQMMPPAPAAAAPVAFQGAGQSFAPQMGSLSSVPEPLTRSTAPVAADIDFDLDTVSFAKKRSPAKWIVGIAAVLGGLGFAAMNASSEPEAIPPGPAAAAPAAPPAYESPPPAQPTPITPAVTKPALSDDAKRALMDADKTRAAKAHQQKASQRSSGGSAPSRPGKKGDPFHKGGDKYDPLNASL